MDVYIDSYDVGDSLKRALKRAEEFRATGRVNLLLYAALDTRLCIERTLFEYLVLIKSKTLPGRLERLYSATDLKKAILQEEPEFFRKLEFMGLFVKFLPYDNRVIVVPDLDLLSQCYGRTNDYLHCPKRPDETWQKLDWWAGLEGSLNKAIPHLVDIHTGLVGHMNLSPKGEDFYSRFVDGELSSDEVMAELERTFAEQPPVKT